LYPLEEGQNSVALPRQGQFSVEVHIEIKIITKGTVTV
jgi:hypothetical protein